MNNIHHAITKAYKREPDNIGLLSQLLLEMKEHPGINANKLAYKYREYSRATIYTNYSSLEEKGLHKKGVLTLKASPIVINLTSPKIFYLLERVQQGDAEGQLWYDYIAPILEAFPYQFPLKEEILHVHDLTFIRNYPGKIDTYEIEHEINNMIKAINACYNVCNGPLEQDKETHELIIFS